MDQHEKIIIPVGSFVHFKSRPEVTTWVVVASFCGAHLIRRLVDDLGSHETVRANGENLRVILSSDTDILKEGYVMKYI